MLATILAQQSSADEGGVTADQVQQAVRMLTWEKVGIGALIFLVGCMLAWVVLKLTKPLLVTVGRAPVSARAFAQIAAWAVTIIAFGVAITYTFPSIKPVNIIGGLGVVSIAAGIAFQTVLGNMFAGLVILMREKPVVGDQIAIEDISGTVTDINLSTTTVRTFNGRQVLIPNGTVHTSMMTVQTHNEWVRTAFDVEIRNPKDYERARVIAIEALNAEPAVLNEPEPVAVLRDVVGGLATMEIRFWSGSRQMETVTSMDAAIVAVIKALAAQGVAIGPTTVVEMEEN
ncbi:MULTISPECIES: mechanosensitive ion channel family protein [Corynebacterium]|uniref:mechanosensitive ion channel family protein n=1 Tax=Corynebacterium TaxID=1716 RepID=UPI00124E3B27|nr:MULTISPECIES: mechanosensitive ion channel domain-containing protein [Corynebacterium]